MDRGSPTHSSHLRASLRAACIVLLVLLLFPPILCLWALKREKTRAVLVCWFYRGMRIIAGVRLQVIGDVSPLRPLMLVANHSSYLDIFVLGSIAPLSFTPKLEIRSWPVIGFFCVLADCVFIERRPADMQRAKGEMEEKLRANKVLALFPEGTTGDGIHIKPFKSGFLNLVEAHDLPLQPVSIAYTHIAKQPLDAATREMVSWVGDASFAPHFIRLLGLPYVQVTVEFYDVEHARDHEDRKALAKDCENTIRTGLHARLEANHVTS
jgi:1-acyl-sn-glycerol-3-phosphate acyltransferase